MTAFKLGKKGKSKRKVKAQKQSTSKAEQAVEKKTETTKADSMPFNFVRISLESRTCCTCICHRTKDAP